MGSRLALESFGSGQMELGKISVQLAHVLTCFLGLAIALVLVVVNCDGV